MTTDPRQLLTEIEARYAIPISEAAAADGLDWDFARLVAALREALDRLDRQDADLARLRDALRATAISYCSTHDRTNSHGYDPEIEFCAVCAARAALAPPEATP